MCVIEIDIPEIDTNLPDDELEKTLNEARKEMILDALLNCPLERGGVYYKSFALLNKDTVKEILEEKEKESIFYKRNKVLIDCTEQHMKDSLDKKDRLD